MTEEQLSELIRRAYQHDRTPVPDRFDEIYRRALTAGGSRPRRLAAGEGVRRMSLFWRVFNAAALVSLITLLTLLALGY